MKNIHLFRLFFRDLVRDRFFLFFFVTNLTIALTGLIGLENFKTAFKQSINGRAKEIAGSDLSVSGRKPLPDEKIIEIGKTIESTSSTRRLGFFSMSKAGSRSRLVRVGVFDLKFPFYGKRVFSPKIKNLGENEVVVYPPILDLFDVSIGEKIKIGSKYFQIVSVVIDDSSETFDMGQIAPKVLMTTEGIEWGEFVSRGSTAFYSAHFKTKNKVGQELKNKVIDLVDDPSIRIRVPEDTSGQVGRVLEYLSDFLGLVSIVALFLSLVGGFYLYLSFLMKKRKTISVYKALGIRLNLIKRGLFFQSVIFGGASFFFAFLLSIGLNLLGESLLSPFLTSSFSVHLSLNGALLGLGILVIIFFILIRPLVNQVVSQSAGQLFQESSSWSKKEKSKAMRTFIFLVPILFGLTFFLSSSWKLSLSFLGAIILGLVLINFFLELFFRFFPKVSNLELRLAVRYLGRHRLSTLSIFISIFFGVALMNLLPVVEKSINEEIQGTKASEIPEYFLFDLQEEQISDLQDIAKKNKVELLSLSPMVRARLIKINGKAVKVSKKKAVTREQQREQQFQNRGVNLSYRKTLGPGEEIIEGEIKPYDGNGPFPISLETRYMDRIGVELGDQLTFDIMGVEIDGVITSKRQIKWTSFRPNFFILFPTGVLDETPKTYLAGVKILKSEKQFVNSMIEKLPNVSLVDIRQVVQKVTKVMREMGFALMLMSGLSIFVGLVIVVSLINHQLLERKKDLALFEIIGFTRKRQKRLVMIEFLGLVSFSTIGGVLFGQMIGQVIALKMFYQYADFSIASGIKIFLMLFFSVFFITHVALRSTKSSEQF